MAPQTTLISEWLINPYRLSGEEQQEVAALLERYPYLVPARLMQAGGHFSEQGFSPEMLHDSQLFMGNWMYFYSMMHAAAGERKPNHEPKIAVVSETEEEILNEEETFLMDEVMPKEEKNINAKDELIQPLFVDNYFQHQGINVPDALPVALGKDEETEVDEKSLMVMMGFEEWLLFFKKKNDAKKSDEEDKAIIRSIWQREKLAAAMGEEDDNIPEAVFEMAINSIDRQDIMISEPLAEIHAKQGRYEKAIEIYKKLSLQNPEKKTYFAAKINHLNKENLS